MPTQPATLITKFSAKAVMLTALLSPGVFMVANAQDTASGAAASASDHATAGDDDAAPCNTQDECVKVAQQYRKAAEQGDADAQYRLGLLYYNGAGVAKDTTQAISWLRKSAEQGNADAETTLGWMYEHGDGVAKDTKQAARWYFKAIQHGSYMAQELFMKLPDK